MIRAFVPNVMDRSRYEAVGAATIVVDLDRCGDVEAWAALEGTTIGFGAHVDADQLALASDAGFDEVLPRSAFFRRLPTLFTTT